MNEIVSLLQETNQNINNSPVEVSTILKSPSVKRDFTKRFFILLYLLLGISIATTSYWKLAKQNSEVIKPIEPTEQVLGAETQNQKFGLPVRLIVPAIKVISDIQEVGVSQNGEMGVPDNITDVGWFKLGPRPGENGSAVIAGHFNGHLGEKGVFSDLDKLKKGDKLYVEDDKGKSFVFVVRESRTYDPGYADDVFTQSDKTQLNLITCDGAWDGDKKSYTKRLVVFADLAE